MKPSAPASTHGLFHSVSLISPPLLHLWLLIAGIYYSVILKLLNYLEIRAAEEQGEAEAVGYEETCSAGVHAAPLPRHPAFHTSTRGSCAGWAMRPLRAAAMGQGEGEHSTRSGPSVVGEGSRCCWHL